MVKFRGKTKEGERVGGWYAKQCVGEEGETVSVIIDDDYFPIEVIPSTIAQFTGRLDKNKKEIYSSIPIDGKMSEGGDILKDDVGDIGAVVFGKLPLGKAGDCVCRYSAFYLKCFGKLGSAPMYECQNIGDWMEIIGNQTDNKDLLK